MFSISEEIYRYFVYKYVFSTKCWSYCLNVIDNIEYSSVFLWISSLLDIWYCNKTQRTQMTNNYATLTQRFRPFWVRLFFVNYGQFKICLNLTIYPKTNAKSIANVYFFWGIQNIKLKWILHFYTLINNEHFMCIQLYKEYYSNNICVTIQINLKIQQ